MTPHYPFAELCGQFLKLEDSFCAVLSDAKNEFPKLLYHFYGLLTALTCCFI